MRLGSFCSNNSAPSGWTENEESMVESFILEDAADRHVSISAPGNITRGGTRYPFDVPEFERCSLWLSFDSHLLTLLSSGNADSAASRFAFPQTALNAGFASIYGSLSRRNRWVQCAKRVAATANAFGGVVHSWLISGRAISKQL